MCLFETRRVIHVVAYAKFSFLKSTYCSAVAIAACLSILSSMDAYIASFGPLGHEVRRQHFESLPSVLLGTYLEMGSSRHGNSVFQSTSIWSGLEGSPSSIAN